MSQFEGSHLQTDLKRFPARQFVTPADWHQVYATPRYIRELCKPDDYKFRFNDVQATACVPLTQRDSCDNSFLNCGLISNY